MQFIISLIQNTAILLSFSMLYEYYWIKLNQRNLKNDIITGTVISIAVSIIMFTPFKFSETIVFDVRSILLSISGLFFGFIPTFLAMLTSLVIRLNMGGDGVYMGVAVIISSASIGMLWHYYRKNWEEQYFIELLLLGITVHAVMAFCTIFLPSGKEMDVLKNIALPLILIYIPGTLLLGTLLVRQHGNYLNRKAKEKLIETEYMFHQLMKSKNIYALTLNKQFNIYFANEHLQKSIHLTKEELLNNNFESIFLQKISDEDKRKKEVFFNSALISIELKAAFTTLQNKHYYIHWFITKTFNFQNEHNGYIVIGVDETERYEAEKKLNETHQELLAQYEVYKELNIQLTEAKQKAEESDRLKTMLLSNLSHEVRTPMNAIIGFSELLRKDIPNEKRKEFSEIIFKSSQQLLQTIDDIVLISKLQSQKTKLQVSKIKPVELLKSLLILNQHKIQQPKVEFKIVFDQAHENIIIETDELKLTKILSNLLKNAYNYTPSGKIEMGFYTEEKHIVFFVKDTGLGISDEDKPYIFESFYRGKLSKSFAIRGIGLGLSIVKELTQLLKGEIWFESDPEKGSVFYVKIPTVIAIQDNKNNDSIQKSSLKLDDLKNFNILIVEDEFLNYQFIEALLNPLVKQVDYAQNGSIAIEKCKHQSYDFVLMDIRMPIMNGIETTKHLKQIHPDIKIIALTAYNGETTKEEALQAGCSFFLSKPIYLDQLINAFQQLIQA
ncbi:MAG: response regulator [Bacteroidales bacterium]|nr:response regulator [Bacteroidales bacterium]